MGKGGRGEEACKLNDSLDTANILKAPIHVLLNSLSLSLSLSISTYILVDPFIQIHIYIYIYVYTHGVPCLTGASGP